MATPEKTRARIPVYLLAGAMVVWLFQCFRWANFRFEWAANNLIHHAVHLAAGVAIILLIWNSVAGSLKKNLGPFNEAMLKLAAIYLAAGAAGSFLGDFAGNHLYLVLEGAAASGLFIWLFRFDFLTAAIFTAMMVAMDLCLEIFWKYLARF